MELLPHSEHLLGINQGCVSDRFIGVLRALNVISVTIDCMAPLVRAIYVCFCVLMEAVIFKIPASCAAELERWVVKEAGECRKRITRLIDKTCILSYEIIIYSFCHKASI